MNDDKDLLTALNTNYAVIEFDTKGYILQANSLFLDVMGYTFREIKSKHHRMFCTPDYARTREYRDFWKDLAAGYSQTSEFKRITKEGDIVWLKASYTPVTDEYGNVVKIIKFAQDITSQKLKSSNYESQLNAISKSQAVIEFDLKGIVLDVNENFLKTFSYSRSEVVGKHHSMFCEKSYKNSQEYQIFWQQLNQGKFDTGEYKRLDKNGKTVWIQATYNPILDLQGRPFKVVKFALDITKNKEMILAVEDSAKNLNQSSSNLERVSDNMSAMIHSLHKISEATELSNNITKEAQTKSQSTTQLMSELGRQSKAIGGVVKSISSIAQRTNLLSLNASIEAARAGEAGKGFAVVASEVKALSLQTAAATQEVSQSIVSVQESAELAIEAIASISKIIANMTIISESISSSVHEQSELSNEVSTLMNYSKKDIDHISEAINLISK
ncbi:PAS domain S-box protein [Sulfurimonas aquatica]|uniref:PAS domain S-box protein n=1 Tax=Sulfurimonas aquatica TaxID=2672570 RepID=A0A975AXZ2_9BACT|nr:PAS domain-containing methyl-accepting chemotaxis protein [Sulfurimonas aquatica]QSZ40631.1 PAS domain S-box protein [Sulfurimonas aquatica]